MKEHQDRLMIQHSSEQGGMATDTTAAFEKQISGRPITQVWGRRGMVSSMHPDATLAGLEILRNGGNAVDAAVAVASTLAVTNHNWAGLAGDSAWLIFDSRTAQVHHLDGYSLCPKSMTPERIAERFNIDEATFPAACHEEPEGFRELGICIAMVPGTPHALHAAWKKFGRLPFKQLLERAIDYAETGVVVSNYVAGSISKCRDKLAGFTASRSIFFRDNDPRPEGDILIQSDLAATLRRFAGNPTDEFSRGPTAKMIVDFAAKRSAGLSYADFSSYQPVWREPVEGSYRGRRIVAAGPPTAGPHVVQALNILERVLTSKMAFGSADMLHVLIEALKLALADRRRSGGDPDHIDVPVARLTDKAYASTLASRIAMTTATPVLADSRSTAVGTTHFVVVDNEGNTVSATQTIGRDFGCGEIIPGTGLVMNDRSWWMSLRNGPNQVAPGRRANIGHAPTMVFENESPLLAIGSPGGFGIVPYVVQTLVNIIDYGLDLQQAIEVPRFRLMDLEYGVAIENRVAHNALSDLQNRGHRVDLFPQWTDRVGGVEGVHRDCESGVLYAGYDPRRNSYAAGY